MDDLIKLIGNGEALVCFHLCILNASRSNSQVVFDISAEPQSKSNPKQKL